VTDAFYEDEFFLIEKIIFSQAIQIESIEEIKSLCPPRIDEYVECLDQVEDYDSHRWSVIEDTIIQYADDTTGLPESLQGKIDGNGIFFIEGTSSVNAQQIQRKTEQFQEPIYLYVKYYGYSAGISTYMKVYPVIGGDEELPRTEKFIWGEKMFPLSTAIFENAVTNMNNF